MSLDSTKIGLYFLVLVFFQVAVFNNINLLGHLNPFIYIFFLIIYPFDRDNLQFILLGFLLGLSIDILSVGIGGHTIACLIVSFMRPSLIRFIFGANVSLTVGILGNVRLGYKLLYLGLMVFIHHLLLYSIVYFSMNSFLVIILNTSYTSLFSFILLYIIISFYSKK